MLGIWFPRAPQVLTLNRFKTLCGSQQQQKQSALYKEEVVAEYQRRVAALEGRAREAEAALQESLQRQEKMAAMYEESILERASEEAAECEEVPR